MLYCARKLYVPSVTVVMCVGLLPPPYPYPYPYPSSYPYPCPAPTPLGRPVRRSVAKALLRNSFPSYEGEGLGGG